MSTKDFSSVQESRIAECLGWSRISGSGARPTAPGDVKSEEFLGECKTHVEPGHDIIFQRSVWAKLKDESSARMKFPVLFVDDGSQKLSNTWCMLLLIPMGDYRILDAPAFIRMNKESISFKNSDMDRYHRVKSEGESDVMLYEVEFDGSIAYITRFPEFAALLGVEM